MLASGHVTGAEGTVWSFLAVRSLRDELVVGPELAGQIFGSGEKDPVVLGPVGHVLTGLHVFVAVTRFRFSNCFDVPSELVAAERIVEPVLEVGVGIADGVGYGFRIVRVPSKSVGVAPKQSDVHEVFGGLI